MELWTLSLTVQNTTTPYDDVNRRIRPFNWSKYNSCFTHRISNL